VRHSLAALFAAACVLAWQPAALATGEPGEAAPPLPASAPRAAPAFPFAGAVIGDDVNLRAGPGTNYEVVVKLEGGEKVLVVGEAFGWYIVRPARLVKVFVQKDLIATRGAGVGIILKDRVNLRSRPAPESTVVGQCGRGDVVRLLDADGDWIAVAAPEEAIFYAHHDLVRRLGGPELVERPAAPAVPPEAAPLVAPEKVRRARELYEAELAKPDLDAMDFGPALALFREALETASDADVKRAALAGVKRIEAAQAIQADYRRRVKPVGAILRRD
jgi:SH3-like domain-containing protein